MTDPTIDLFTKGLLECLEETFEQVRGIYLDKGTSLFETLAGISAAEASLPAPHNGATIAAHVEHARFYLDVLDEVLKNQALTRVDWRDIWTRVSEVTPEQWKAQQQALAASYDRIRQTIRTYEHWHGQFGMSGALAVLAHTAYHLGAIRQILRAVAPFRGEIAQ